MTRRDRKGARAYGSYALLAVVLLIPGCSQDAAPAGESAAPLQPLEAPPTPPPAAERDESEPLGRNTVEVYFPSILGNGLVGEYSEIFETITPGDRVKQIVADLIEGPTNPEAVRALPVGTRLRQAYVLDSGVCYLDFTNDLTEGVGGGSMEELLTIYSVIDSVVYNVAEINRVAILVEGQPLDSLNGHLDLRRPLAPDFSLILAPVVVETDGRDESDSSPRELAAL